LLARPDTTPLLAQIRCPTLLLCGRDDAWSPPARHQFMHERIAGSRLVVIEQCGHMSTMEQPGAVNAALAAWLDASAPIEPS
jgi:pimeloyl-ACP methyl ester carboxylesterase